MKKTLFASLVIILGSLFLAFFPSQVRAVIPHNGGEYINLCGTDTAATAHTCNGGCNIYSGSCSGTFVIRTVCEGRTTHCDGGHTIPYVVNEVRNGSLSLDIASGTNKTVQIDVFDKECRNADGSWICGGDRPKDYIVWYSGNYPVPTATPTPTAVPTVVPTLTPTPIPTAVPTTTPVSTSIQCPAGFVQTISGSNIICLQQAQIQTQTQTAQGGSAYARASTGAINVNVERQPVLSTTTVPQVVTVPVVQTTGVAPVKELPKTGLPPFAWLFSGVAPVGFALRRFGRSEKGLGGLERFLWQKREFDRS